MDTLLDDALNINTINSQSIQKGLLNPYRPEEREPLFVSRLTVWQDVVMSYFGDPDGEFYGARRNRDGALEVVTNNALTGGASRYYSVDENGRAMNFVTEYPDFDCRSRPWYKEALRQKKAVFSPVYKHFVFNDLAITASLPIYEKKGNLTGVLGVDYLLGSVNSFLQEQKIVEGMVIFIVEEETGYLIANSELMKNFTIDEEGTLKRYRPDNINNEQIRNIFSTLQKREVEEVVRQNGRLNKLSRFAKENIEWYIYISIPEEPFLSDFNDTRKISLGTIIFFVILSAVLAFFLSRYITDPISQLSDAAEAFKLKKWHTRVPVQGSNEVALLSGTFNTMAEELQELMETLEKKVEDRTAELNDLNKTKDQLFAIIAHDLRGPLSSSSQLLDQLLESFNSFEKEELEAIIKTIGESQKSIYQLLENLLLWALNQRNEVTFNPQDIPVTRLIEEILLLLQGRINEKELAVHYSSSNLLIRGDRDMISTVIRNLISNAIKYTPRNGEIEILCSQLDNEVEISVRDNGTGMDEETIKHLQVTYKRNSRPGTEGEKGTGLGLIIVGDFLARHHSSLMVTSIKGEGSSFSFRLPQGNPAT